MEEKKPDSSVGSKEKAPRQYPPFWERAVPIVVVIIGILILGLVLVAASVALGIFPD